MLEQKVEERQAVLKGQLDKYRQEIQTRSTSHSSVGTKV